MRERIAAGPDRVAIAGDVELDIEDRQRAVALAAAVREVVRQRRGVGGDAVGAAIPGGVEQQAGPVAARLALQM